MAAGSARPAQPAPGCDGLPRVASFSVCRLALLLALAAVPPSAAASLRSRAPPAALLAQAKAIVGSSTFNSTTTSNSTNSTINATLAAIEQRFTEMDTKVASARTRLEDLQQQVAQLSGLANITVQGLNGTSAKILAINATVQTNKGLADLLKVRFVQSAAALQSATSGLATLGGEVAELEKRALTVGKSASDLGSKVGQLEDVMKDVLPGPHSIESRITRASATLANYSVQASAGTLDPLLAKDLEDLFQRATARTQSLAEDAAERRMEVTGS